MIRLFVRGVLALGLIGSVFVGSAAAASKSRPPVVLKPKWRLVNPQLGVVGAANERYVLFNSPNVTGQVTLFDEQTGKISRRSVPDESCFGSRTFGGPWLMVEGCRSKPIWLYNLTIGRWVGIDLSAQRVDSVGRYWIRFFRSDPQCEAVVLGHCELTAYLQNIKTGAVKLDPATVGGRIYDDLNTPTGSRPLCAPLRYPDEEGPASTPMLGWLTFYGQFAITEGNAGIHLRRCGSRLDLTLPGLLGFSLFANSRAVIWNQLVLRRPLRYVAPVGLFFPSLRRFTMSVPADIRARGGGVIALTRRTIYLGSDLRAPRTPCGGPGYAYLGDICGHVWAAHFPGK